MRIHPIAFTSALSLFVALPALAQAPAAPAPAAADPAAPAAPDAAAAAPAETPAQTPTAPEATAGSASAEGSVSAGTGTSAVTAEAATTAPAAGSSGGGGAAPSNVSARGNESAIKGATWEMEFHGYLRAPMRFGMGKRDNPLDGQSANTFHYPVIPDDQYLNWQFTSHNKKDWAEVFLSYGTPYAKGVVALQGFNFTDASWNIYNANFGISQGYVALTPDLGYENFRLSGKAGAFWARYGLAGKWDAGEYDTYLIGRTHVMGALARIEYDVDDANMLWVEGGFGAKRPNPTQFNNARFTMLGHGHVGFRFGNGIEVGAHYMHSFAKEEDRILQPPNPNPAGTISEYQAPNYPSAVMEAKDGSVSVMGADARLELGAFGFAFLGYSHISAKNALVVAPAIEVLHSYGGGEFQNGVTDNYFGPSCRGVSLPANTSGPFNTSRESPKNAAPYSATGPSGCSEGNGAVDSILAQWEFSLTNFLQQSSGGQKFWGDGQDVKATIYGMFNKVKSDVETFDGITKLKYGADVQAQILPWLTFATRYDRVQPNSDIANQSFSILSPRLIFKSTWNTREQIAISYSRYMYNQRECADGVNPAFNTSESGPYVGFPYDAKQLQCVQPPSAPSSPEAFGAHYQNLDPQTRGAPATRPDINVFKVEASMWW